MVRPTASTERIAAGRLPPTESDSATAATAHSEATKPASGLPFRPRCADVEIATKSAVNSECWSWEELGAPALPIPAGTRADSMSGADAAASTGDQQAVRVEARVDADCGEAVDASAADIAEDSPVASATQGGVCANIEDTTVNDDSHQQMQVQSAPAPAPPIQTNSLSLVERQRLQREAQQAFLRSKGIASASSSGEQNAAAQPKGGAGAIAPAAREGFVAHRDVSGKIANLRNAVQKKTSGVGARSAAGPGTTISRTGSNVSASNDSPTGTCSAANATASTEQHGRDDSISEATSYPPYPAYPQTMIALGYKLGDPRDKKGSGSGATVDDAVSSMLKGARKAGVAVTGGAMVAVGAVLTPLPTPGGILIAGAGLGVLSTEFEGAKKVMDKGRDKLVDLIDSIDDDKKKEEAMVEADDENQDEEDESKKISEDVDEANEKDEVVSDAGTSSAGCSRRSSETSQKGAAAVQKSIPAPGPSTSTSSFRSGLSRIGKSIRPLLTDDEAPRRAMDELKTKSERRMNEMKSSTQRTYMKMRSHLNTVVDQLALPDNEALGHHDFAASSDAAGSSKPAASEVVKAEKAPMASLEGKDTCGDSSVPGNDTLR